MDIVIGATSPVGQPPRKSVGPGNFIEAAILNIRPPRRGQGKPPAGRTDRRSDKYSGDPVGSRVVVLLVPEGSAIPNDIDSGNYRIFLRFAKRKK
ncbi:MAG: hypothetical protein DRG59_04085 [Deltaproteobacteria bacterium]|nr:MAG: hypothetical protein DRG59_04085 [Deltaproteobacteria bacterium]HDL07349.1 hypothetical protein [Desulfobacteraceae bacterium]